MKELWKKIPGHQDAYSVSNLGQIRNDKTGKPLKTHFSNYYRVRLYYKKPSVSYLVHRLVALAFLPQYYKKREVNHKDFNRKNNYVGNLEFVTRIQNTDHAFHRRIKGEQSHLAKLTETEIIAIRKERQAGKLLKDIAKRYNTTDKNVSAIVLHKSWSHV